MHEPNVGRILDFWEAYDRVHALPDPWYETATICQTLSMLISVQAAGTGGEMPLQPQRDFMPPRWVPPPATRTKERVVSDEELTKRLDGIFKGK